MILRLLHLVWLARLIAACYEPSVAHPPPDYEVNDAGLHQAFARLDSILTSTVSTPEWDAASFSVEVTSSKRSLWSHHHTARQRNSSRPDIPEVNGDALYRIASITKTFTVLGILYQHAAGNLSLDDSVENYIDELRGNQNGSLPWKDITLRSLASQLSGIPREFAQADLINSPSFMPFPPEKLGLPPAESIPRDDLPACDEYAHYKPSCTVADLLKAVKSKVPLFAPNQKSSYSNVAFELLGLVLERVANQTYESYIDDAIFKPLGMTKSTLSTPPDKAGVIPLEPHFWGVDEGVQNPTGGIYSSSTDLSKYLRYVLSRYNGLTSALNWAHPTSPTEGLYSFYGTPWEILRTDKILVDSRRAVQFNTKGGGVPGYSSIIIMVPEYDLGITILATGGAKLVRIIMEAVTVNIVRAAEEIAINQLDARYAGTYVSTEPSLNSSLTLKADRRGLVITDLISNSTDVFNSPFPALLGAPEDQAWYAQLVPTLLYTNETEQSGEKWRVVVVREHDDMTRGVWDDFCVTNMDSVAYGVESINEFVFWPGQSTVSDAVELVGFRATLKRAGQNERDSKAGTRGEETLEL